MESDKPFKVVTYNIHRGLSAFRRTDVLARIVMILEESQADIICLQEVWAELGRRKPDFERLAEAVWAHRAYGRNAVVDKGHQGNVILSRFPILRWTNIDLSVRGFEPRGGLHAKIAHPSGTILSVLCQHFGLAPHERDKQAGRLIEELTRPDQDPSYRAGEALIMGGDFNDWNGRLDAVFLKRLGVREAYRATEGGSARTFPSVLPILPLDRLYYRGCEALSSRVHHHLRWKGLSDHLPLEAEFLLLKK